MLWWAVSSTFQKNLDVSVFKVKWLNGNLVKPVINLNHKVGGNSTLWLVNVLPTNSFSGQIFSETSAKQLTKIWCHRPRMEIRSVQNILAKNIIKWNCHYQCGIQNWKTLSNCSFLNNSSVCMHVCACTFQQKHKRDYNGCRQGEILRKEWSFLGCWLLRPHPQGKFFRKKWLLPVN